MTDVLIGPRQKRVQKRVRKQIRKRQIGIYAITNILNNKVYIGSSVVINRRWVEHKRTLNNNSHPNIHLLRAWLKDKSDSFQFSIIEFCDSDVLLDRESYWITYYKSLSPEFGYNLNMPNAINISKSFPRNKHSIGLRYKLKIVVININTQIVIIDIKPNVFFITGISDSKISRVMSYWKQIFVDPNLKMKNKHRTCEGYIFMNEIYYDSQFDYINYVKPRAVAIRKPAKVKISKLPIPYSERNIKRIKVLCRNIKTGEETICTSVLACSKEMNFKLNKIHHVTQKAFGLRSHRGFYFSRI